MGTLEKMFELIEQELGISKEEPKPSEAEVVQAPLQPPVEGIEELDPPAPAVPSDPFAKLVDGMLRESGVDVDLEIRRPYKATAGNVNQHDWAIGRERLFSDEPYIFKCKRCFSHVHVDSSQTIDQALVDKGVDPNCSAQIVADINEM